MQIGQRSVMESPQRHTLNAALVTTEATLLTPFLVGFKLTGVQHLLPDMRLKAQ